jgi:hypothetical protein
MKQSLFILSEAPPPPPTDFLFFKDKCASFFFIALYQNDEAIFNVNVRGRRDTQHGLLLVKKEP